MLGRSRTPGLECTHSSQRPRSLLLSLHRQADSPLGHYWHRTLAPSIPGPWGDVGAGGPLPSEPAANPLCSLPSCLAPTFQSCFSHMPFHFCLLFTERLWKLLIILLPPITFCDSVVNQPFKGTTVILWHGSLSLEWRQSMFSGSWGHLLYLLCLCCRLHFPSVWNESDSSTECFEFYVVWN